MTPAAGALAGWRVLLTGPDSEPLARRLEELGATPLSIPTIAIRPALEGGPLDGAARRMGEYDWIVVTSPRGARALFDRRRALGLGAPPEGPRWAAVGPRTAAEIRAAGARVARISGGGTGAAIARELGAEVDRARILLPRARIAGRALPDALASRGAVVDEIVAYETELGPESSRARLARALEEGVRAVVFTSGSTVDGFARLAGDLPAALHAAAAVCIGPTTARALERHGVRPTVVAARRTPDALARAIEELTVART